MKTNLFTTVLCRKVLRTHVLFILMLVSSFSYGQTNPAAFDLSTGNFSFLSQTATSTTYPTNMQGWTTGTNNITAITTAAPGANQALIASGTASTSGLSNLGVNGFNFLVTNTLSQVGEIAVALNSTGRNNLLVSWTAADNLASASRVSALALQYRVGTTGVFTTVAGTTYTSTAAAQAAAQNFTNIALPSACDNQAVVQIRWIYWEVSGAGGRDPIRLDDITVTSSAAAATFTSTGIGGDWNVGMSWVGGNVPSAGATVNIVGPININNTTGAISNTGIININTNGTLLCGFNPGASLTGTGVVNVNGTGILAVEQGGWPGTTNSFNYGNVTAGTGTLKFNNTSGSYGVNNTDNWFPATITNVNVAGAGGITLNSAHTISNLFQASATVVNPGNITANGTLQLNAGYGWSGTGSPIYGPASLLKYNSGGSPGRGIEWNQSTGTIGTTPGYPNNVQVSNSTTLNFANGSSSTFKADKSVIIDSGSALYQNYGGGNAGLIVGTDLTANGNLTLGTSSGDLTIGGNFTVDASANFVSNGRAVFFNGGANQTITKTPAGTVDFDYLVIDKPTIGTNLILNSSIPTNININGTAGNVLQIINTGGLDLNGRPLSLNNNGGGIYVNGPRTIFSSIGTPTIVINQSKFVGNNAGTGTLSLGSTITVALSANGNLDFGKSGANYITTLNGTLSLNSTTNCFVNTNPPIYGNTSLLKYNSGGVYSRGVEWSAISGAGYPNDVQVTNNTTLDIPNTGGTFTTNLALARDLTIDAGSALYMDYGAGAASGSLTVGRNVNIAGALSLGDAFGGDMNVAGNWTRTGTFTPNGRAVTFNGGTQTLTGSTSFDFLIMNNSGGLTLQATSPVAVNQGITFTAGSITIGANNINIPGSFGITTGSVASHIITNSTGRLVRTGVGSTARLFPVGLTATKYSPITLTNTTGTADLSVNVSGTITNTVFEPTQIVNLQWNISSTAATTATVSPTWQAGDYTGNFTPTGPGELGNYTSAYAVYPVTLNTTTTTATGVALQSGSNAIVIGNTGAVFTAAPANDLCANPVALTINAPATNGTLKGATRTTPFTAGINDVWYKFTVTQPSDYTITVGGFNGDVDFELFNTECPTSSTSYIDRAFTLANPEVLTINLATGDYYVRVNSANGSTTASKSVFTIAVTAPKILSANGTTALDFGTVTKNNVSATQSLNASAIFLAASQVVTVTAPANYEVALTDTPASFGSSVSLTADSNGVIASTPIYVRFNSAAACGAVSGNVVLSATGATSVNVAVTATAAVTAPIAIDAADVTDTSFTANWNVVTGATGYELEVSKSPTFGTSSTGTLTEGFESATFPPTGWVNTNWSRSTSAGDINSGIGAAIAGANTGVLTTIAVANPTSLSFYLGRSTNSTAKTLTIEVSTTSQTTGFTAVATYDHNNVPSNSYNQYSVDLSAYNANPVVYIRFTKTSSTTSPWRLDDIAIDYASSTPDFVTGYAPKIISGGTTISSPVTGLEAGTQYYYRVRAVTGTCKSVNSNVISVLTDNKVTWNGTAWSNGTGPTANLEATIRGPFVTGVAPQNDFTAKKLTVATGGSVQITADHYIKVINEFINNLTAAEFVVESDGNFWQTTSATNNGDITVKRNITRKDGDQYNYLISPTVGTNLKTDIYGPGNSAALTLFHIESSNTFGSSMGTYIKGRGLAVKEPASASGSSIAIFKGVPMNEAFGYNLLNSNVNGGTTLGYNLTGNPYPSNIDLNKLYNLNTNKNKISATFYFWDNTVNSATTQGGNTYNGAAYAVFNAVAGSTGTGLGAGTLIGNVTGTKEPTRVVKTGQGFMVKSIAANNSPLDFNNDIRIADAGVFFGKNGKSESTDDRFYLKLTAPTNVTTQSVVVYFEGGIDTFAADDSEIIGNPSDLIYTLIGNQKAIINGRAPFVNTDRIPLGTNSFTAGTYVFSLGTREGTFANGQNIYLKDIQTGILTNLSEGNYTFTANAGESTGRFEIVYLPETVLATDGNTNEELVVYKDSGDFVVKAQSKKITDLQVFDMNGRLIYSVKPNAVTVTVPAAQLVNGTYLLKIDQGGKLSTKKVIR